jgi:endoglucanase
MKIIKDLRMSKMKQIIPVFLTIFLFAIFQGIFAQNPLPPVGIHGALKVEGNRILDKYGNPPRLRGVCFSWSVWGGKKYYTSEVVDWLTIDFKATLVRASMAVEPEGGYLSDPEGQKKLVYTVVDRAIENGIYVLIDWHDHNAEKNLEEAKTFFALMAQKYSGVPNVIYEIWNEPARQTWDVVKAYEIEVIKIIRKYDPVNLIVAGSPRWDQDVDIAAADPIRGFENIAYSFHFYASDNWHQDELRAKAELAMQRGIALFVTEWGVGESNGDGIFDRERTAKWMDWMEKYNLRWANWNFTDKKETTALVMPGASVQGGWNSDQLTEAGRYIREQLRKLN